MLKVFKFLLNIFQLEQCCLFLLYVLVLKICLPYDIYFILCYISVYVYLNNLEKYL